MTAVDHAELKRDSRAPLPPEILADALGRIWTDEVFEVGERLIHGDNLIAMAVERLRTHAALLSEIEGLKAERAETEKRTSKYFVAMREAQTNSAVYKHDKLEAERQLAALRTQAPDSWRPDRARVHDEILMALFNACDVISDETDAAIFSAAGRIVALRPQTAESGK